MEKKMRLIYKTKTSIEMRYRKRGKINSMTMRKMHTSLYFYKISSEVLLNF